MYLSSANTEIWTHVYAAQGTGLDMIMFGLFRAQTVSIYNSPAVPDRGGHSVLGGLLTGKGFDAILPNLAVCVQTPGRGNVCTPICKPGHSCLAQPFRGPWNHSGGNPAISASVYDIDRPDMPDKAHTHLIATSTQDPAECTSAHHCKWPVADPAAYGDGSEVEISFGHACEPADAHVIQFVYTLVCDGLNCPAAQSIQDQLQGYGTYGCGGVRAFGKWYLDNGDCSKPFLTPELFCNATACNADLAKVPNGTRFATDEPSVVYPPGGGPNARQMQKHFIDFMICGTQIEDVIQWTRTGIGAQPCERQDPNGGNTASPRVFKSNYQVLQSTDVQKIKSQICNVETPDAAKPAMANPSYQAIRNYLQCGN